ADGVLEVADGAAHRGREAIAAFLAGAGASLRTQTGRSHVRHLVANLRITLSAPAEATGASTFLVLTERGLDHWGRYRDAYVEAGGRWLFRQRRVRVDAAPPGTGVAERPVLARPEVPERDERDRRERGEQHRARVGVAFEVKQPAGEHDEESLGETEVQDEAHDVDREEARVLRTGARMRAGAERPQAVPDEAVG